MTKKLNLNFGIINLKKKLKEVGIYFIEKIKIIFLKIDNMLKKSFQS